MQAIPAMSATISQPASETRSVTELIIQTVARYQYLCTCEYGHLDSLLQLPKNLRIGYVVVFLFYPSFIIGQLIYGFYAAAKYELAHHGMAESKADFRFMIQGMMGVHATGNLLDHGVDDESPVPLFKAGHQSVQRATCKVSWKWLARVLVCLVAVIQAIGTVVLFVRRILHDGSVDMIDAFNGLAALGTTFSGIVALLFLLMRLEWQATRPIRTEIPGRSQLLTMGTQIVITFVCTGWIRGYISRYLLYLIYLMYTAGNLFELVVIGSFLVLIFGTNFFKRARIPVQAVRSFILGMFVIAIAGDTIASIITSILELTKMKNGRWKDPISDKLFAI